MYEQSKNVLCTQCSLNNSQRTRKSLMGLNLSRCLVSSVESIRTIYVVATHFNYVLYLPEFIQLAWNILDGGGDDDNGNLS